MCGCSAQWPRQTSGALGGADIDGEVRDISGGCAAKCGYQPRVEVQK